MDLETLARAALWFVAKRAKSMGYRGKKVTMQLRCNIERALAEGRNWSGHFIASLMENVKAHPK